MSGTKKIECATEGCTSFYDGEDYGVEITWHCISCEVELDAAAADDQDGRHAGVQDTITFPVRWRDQKVHWRNRRYRT